MMLLGGMEMYWSGIEKKGRQEVKVDSLKKGAENK